MLGGRWFTITKMAAVFPHSAPGDPIMGYQLSEIP
ncbi:unnamed protein product, partial [Wuchereria bancrofti]